MSRPVYLGLLVTLIIPAPGFCEPLTKDAGTQRAMGAAREHLRAGRPAEAVSVLEAELVNADGNGQFLALLREAYSADLRDLKARNADEATLDPIRRRLQALDGKADHGPAAVAAEIHSPAPPIPDPPVDPVPAAVLGPTPAGDVGDPFQQAVREPAVPKENLRRASDAFAARRYAEAAKLFAEAARAGESFSPAQRDQWTYSRLHGVAMRLNKGPVAPADLVDLEREVDDARKSGSEHVGPFANQLSAELQRRGASTGGRPVDSGWQVAETTNFRVMHRGETALAADVGQTAEAARIEMYERWAGAPAAAWSPRCDIYLYATASDYSKATAKPSDSPGHSTVGITGGRVVSRRIDLRLDEPTLLDTVLPSEVTQVVLADLFADQPLPRWALVGMAALSESPAGVARYQRAVPGMLLDKKLYAVGPFLDQPNFPDRAAVTAFYAESVSLVSFLVERKGPKAFATFLREAPRRGYARALTTHYGFKDPADLQDQWVKHVLGGE
jgi:hypothetical protein